MADINDMENIDPLNAGAAVVIDLLGPDRLIEDVNLVFIRKNRRLECKREFQCVLVEQPMWRIGNCV